MGINFSACCNEEKNESVKYQISITNNIFESKNQNKKIEEAETIKKAKNSECNKKILDKIKIQNLFIESDIILSEYIYLLNKNLITFSKNLSGKNIQINFSDYKIDQEKFRNLIKKYNHIGKCRNKIKDDDYFKKIIDEHFNNLEKNTSLIYQYNTDNSGCISNKNLENQKNEKIKDDENSDFLSNSICVYPIAIDSDKEEYFFGEIKIDMKKYSNFKNKNKEKINSIKSLFNFEGYAVIINKDFYSEGIFHENKLNGPGRIINTQGEIFCGNFLNYKLNNFGHYTNNQGKYEGYLLNNERHGIGKEFFNDGSIYEGSYDSNKKQGKGKFIWADGSIYEGNFDNDSINGYGYFQWPDNSYYEGQWKKGKIDGQGKLNFFNGQYYEGEFSENKKCGKGKYFYNSNRYFEGNWKNNLENGEGFLILGDKKHYGIWKDGKLMKKLNK